MSQMPLPPERGMNLPARVTVSLRAGAVLAVANIVCIIIFSWAWVHVRAQPKTIVVTGSARQPIDSDLIVWTCRIYGSDPKLENAYGILKSANDRVTAFLGSKNVLAPEITIDSINIRPVYARDTNGHDLPNVDHYELSQDIEVTSADVSKVADAARGVTELIKEGIYLESLSPRYLYTKMSDMKITMLAEATKDATARAKQIATNSDAKLGEILDAKMGVMQINALHSNDVSDSGNNDTSSFHKEITAVVTAHFALR